MNPDSKETAASPAYHEPFRIGRIFTALVALTLATFASVFIRDSFANVWTTTTNTMFILLVATAKASLVVLFFMHFKYERAWKFALCVPPTILAILTVLALLPDIGFDTWPHAGWK